jgi:hypothetical protein
MPLVPVKDLLNPAGDAIINTDYVVRAVKAPDRWTVTMAVPGGTWFQIAVSESDMDKLVRGSSTWTDGSKAKPKAKPKAKAKAKPDEKLQLKAKARPQAKPKGK